MSQQISAGELAVGQFVTVLEWEPIVHEPDAFSAMVGITTASTVRDNSYKGDVLEVMAVQLPFIVVRDKRHPHLIGNFTLDTRQLKLMELSKEFVAAATKLPHHD